MLIWLVLACLLPGVIGAAAFFINEYWEGRSQLEKDTLQTARALAQAVDNQILRVEALAQGLATATSLARGDLAGFHSQARQTLKRATLISSVVLVDKTGWQVLNTLKEFGEPLPMNGNPALMRRVFETGESVVSDLYIGAVLRRPIMTVAVPVIIDGEVAYVLICPIRPDKFSTILSAQGVPPGWVASILDSTGTVAARTRATEEVVGKKSSPDFVRSYMATHEGALETVSTDAVPLLSVFTRSPITKWGVRIDIPKAELETPLGRRLTLLAIGVSILFAIGLGLAWFIGERIARSFQSLIAHASALGSGETVSLPSAEVKEAAELTQALGEAAELLEKRNAALQAATQTLRDSEEKYRSLFTNMTEAFALGEPIFDEQGKPVDIRYLEVNEAFHQQTGLSTDILGRPHRDYLPEVEQLWIDRFAAVAMTGQPDRIDSYSVPMRRHYDVRVFSPSPGRFAILFRDVTEQKRMEMALQDSEQRYKALFNNKTMGIAHQRFVTDNEGRPVDYYYEAMNDVCQRIIGMKREDVIGKRVTEVFPGIRDFEFDFMGEFGRIALEGGEGEFEYYFPPTRQWVSLYAYSPKFGECTVIFTDITARKEAEAMIRQINADLEQRVALRTQELTRANEALLASNEELKRFAYIASHDLQTPLRTITGFSQILQKDYRGRLDQRADEYLDRVIEGAHRMHVLIRDLLAYSRVDSQGNPFEPVEFQEIFQSVITSLDESIREAGAKVTHGDLPRVLGDRSQLTQLLQNLIENALKYRSPEPLHVHVWAERQLGEWRFSVQDNGIGIEVKHQEAIFELFRRLHTQQAYPGTGIGLSVCRRVVERHGGRIWVESEPGHGSVFQFMLPIVKEASHD